MLHPHSMIIDMGNCTTVLQLNNWRWTILRGWLTVFECVLTRTCLSCSPLVVSMICYIWIQEFTANIALCWSFEGYIRFSYQHHHQKDVFARMWTLSYVKLNPYGAEFLLVRWPDQGTPQNFWGTILLHFFIWWSWSRIERAWSVNPGAFREIQDDHQNGRRDLCRHSLDHN